MSQRSANPDLEMASRLIMVRKYLKLTQGELGEVVGLSQPMIAQIEKGVKEAPVSVFKMLFLKHNISPLFMMALDTKMEAKKVKKDLIPDLSELLADMEIMKAQVKQLEQALKIKSEK